MDKRNSKKCALVFHWFRVSPETMWATYFCITPAYGFTNKTKHKIQFPNMDSAILTVPHSTKIIVPVFVKLKIVMIWIPLLYPKPTMWLILISWIFLKLAQAPRPPHFHNFYVSQNSMIWYVTLLFLKYRSSFWLSG